VNYREADITDLKQLQQVGKDSYSEFSEVLDGEHWEKMNLFLNDEQALIDLISQSKVFVCEVDDIIRGMVFFVGSGHTSKMFSSEWSCIRYLGVMPEYRGRGIGKQLTELCLSFAKKTNEEHISLHSSEFMNRARNMYEKMGFEKIKNIKHYGKNYWIYLRSFKQQH